MSEPATDGATATEPTPSPTAERPGFAKAWPRDAALDALLAAFDAGDYATVRRDGPRLVEASGDELVKRAAEELVRRTRPDPLSTLLIVVAFALLAFLSFWYLGGQHRH